MTVLAVVTGIVILLPPLLLLWGLLMLSLWGRIVTTAEMFAPRPGPRPAWREEPPPEEPADAPPPSLGRTVGERLREHVTGVAPLAEWQRARESRFEIPPIDASLPTSAKMPEREPGDLDELEVEDRRDGYPRNAP